MKWMQWRVATDTKLYFYFWGDVTGLISMLLINKKPKAKAKTLKRRLSMWKNWNFCFSIHAFIFSSWCRIFPCKWQECRKSTYYPLSLHSLLDFKRINPFHQLETQSASCLNALMISPSAITCFNTILPFDSLL